MTELDVATLGPNLSDLWERCKSAYAAAPSLPLPAPRAIVCHRLRYVICITLEYIDGKTSPLGVHLEPVSITENTRAQAKRRDKLLRLESKPYPHLLRPRKILLHRTAV